MLNATNETAVAAFLAGRIGFTDICRVVEATLEAHDPFDVQDLPAVEAADEAGRHRATEVMATVPVGGPR